ncbi:MAG: 50S ribosomal protein L10 [Candidatus Thermoplasmatota archaeon]|nr:50S ribosomal protein L10 [Candidatus Thermoplasmatota archaeon]
MADAIDHPKAATVRELADWLTRARVVGLAGIEGIPAPQMQQIRARLRGAVDFRIIKNRLLRRALETAASERSGIEGLEEFITGPTALVATEENPFRLYKELEATMTRAPARGGELAPEDIVVREGDTPFKPGPIVGDLQKAGVPAAIERGKVVIKKDIVLVEAGQKIRREVAQVLTRMEIFPLTVGLDLRGVLEDGQLYTPEHLAVDEERIRGDLAMAATQAHRLAFEMAYPTRETTPTLLGIAQDRALALALAAEYPVEEVLTRLLAEAHARMGALASHVPEGLDDELKADLGTRTAGEGSDEAEADPEETPEKVKKGKAKDEGADDEEEAAAGLSSLFG